MSKTIRLTSCPTCHQPSLWTKQNRWKPFCSERCKLIDLGAWANEDYRIPEEITPSSTEETPREGEL